MNQEYISKIQNKVIKLLNSRGKYPLIMLSRHCCSEVSRLVGSWMQEVEKPKQISILKGDGLDNNSAHDVLAVLEDTTVRIIDPTIWQFSPNKDIFVGEFASMELAFTELSKIYGGEWRISEELNNITDVQKKKWESIIRKILSENISDLKEKK